MENGIQHTVILQDTILSTSSIYDLMRYLSAESGLIDLDGYKAVYPLYIGLNEGVFTKGSHNTVYPEVGIRQDDIRLILTCTCNGTQDKLCPHQIEILDAVLRREDYRLFFDDRLRDDRCRYVAKDYGLATEGDMDSFFQLHYRDGKTEILPKQQELLRIDSSFYKRNNFARTKSVLVSMDERCDISNWILVLSKHRFYEQIHFLLYEGTFSQKGSLKNPLTPVDLSKQVLLENEVGKLKFLTALLSLQNRFEGESNEIESMALRLVASNPLGLQVYYHDRSRSDNVSAKSVFPVKLLVSKPELKLSVLQKSPFYEIKGTLLILDTAVPLSQLVLRHEYFVFFREQYIYVPDPDLMRFLYFLKDNKETLLIHANKYETFVSQFLTPIEEYVHVEYDYIYTAEAELLPPLDYGPHKLIYLQKEGFFVTITPVVRYADMEVPVYSRKQLYSVDEAGNRFKIQRNSAYENQFTASILLQHPDFEEQLQYAQYFYLHKDKFFDESWFLSAFEVWRDQGITILGFQDLDGTRINPYVGKVDIKVNSGKDWFNVHLKVDFGEQIASIRQLQRAFKNKSKFVELDDGTLGLLPQDWIEKIGRYFSISQVEKELLHIPRIRFSEVSASFESDVLTHEAREELVAIQNDFLNAEQIPKVDVPVGIKTVLRDYQRRGLDWLCHLDRFRFGGCLADDMGLGKTVQIIAFLLHLKAKYGAKTNLIVVPTSLLFNWEDEIARFAPSLSVLNYNRTPRRQQIFTEYDVVLTSYGVLTSDINFFKKQYFQYVLLDEAQLIKNPNSERYKTVCLLKSVNRIVMTGTPIENSTFDIFGLLSFACPGLLGNKQFFRDTYATPIDQFELRRRATELEQRIAPFILRRTKRQVIHELPEKTETVIYCEMNTMQRSIYASYEDEVRNYITSTNPDILDRDRLHVLAFLTKLRQICNAPALLQEGHSPEHSTKINVLIEQIQDKMHSHKILVFSQFVGMLDLIKNRLEDYDIPYSYLTGQSRDRKAVVDDFQDNDATRVFLISLKAGGVGLNLTGADFVYLVDPWWNPAVESQAIDRSYRIGQDKKVTAVRLICTNTIEEKIMDLQKRKQKLVGDLITTESNWFDTLSKQDLLNLVSETD